MFVKSLNVRECSGAYFINEVSATTLESIYTNILHSYKLILMCGIPSTGKSYFIKDYIPKPNSTFTKWNRENIMSMIYNDGKRIERLNKHIEQLESVILTEMLNKEFHQVLVDGWYTIPYHRKKVLSYSGGERSLCLVFDGDVSDIKERVRLSNKLRIPEEEIDMYIDNKHSSAIWPNFSEGWTDIIYMCSFSSEASLKYMKQTLKKVDK